MSKLDLIKTALDRVNVYWSYADSDITTMPRLIVNFVSNRSVKLSNLKHTRITRYQIDLYSRIPLDVESDDTLLGVEEKLLECGLKCTDWQEVSDVDIEKELSMYRYYIEVF